MKTLAKYHVCNHCVIGEKAFKNIPVGPVSYRDFRETGPRRELNGCYVDWKGSGFCPLSSYSSLTALVLEKEEEQCPKQQATEAQQKSKFLFPLVIIPEKPLRGKDD